MEVESETEARAPSRRPTLGRSVGSRRLREILVEVEDEDDHEDGGGQDFEEPSAAPVDRRMIMQKTRGRNTSYDSTSSGEAPQKESRRLSTRMSNLLSRGSKTVAAAVNTKLFNKPSPHVDETENQPSLINQENPSDPESTPPVAPSSTSMAAVATAAGKWKLKLPQFRAPRVKEGLLTTTTAKDDDDEEEEIVEKLGEDLEIRATLSGFRIISTGPSFGRTSKKNMSSAPTDPETELEHGEDNQSDHSDASSVTSSMFGDESQLQGKTNQAMKIGMELMKRLGLNRLHESRLSILAKLSIKRWSHIKLWICFAKLKREAMSLDELCSECPENKQKQVMRWCPTCPKAYCVTCCKSAHEACGVMRAHTNIVHIFARPVAEPLALPQPKAESLPQSSLMRMPPSESKTTTTMRRPGITKMNSMLVGTGGRHEECCIKGCHKAAVSGIGLKFCTEHRSSTSPETAHESSLVRDLMKRVQRLKDQLTATGQEEIEHMELPIIRQKMAELYKRIHEGDEDPTIGDQIEKLDKIMRMNEDYKREEEEKMIRWIEDNRPKNEACLRLTRSWVPLPGQIDLKYMQQHMPPKIAKRVWEMKKAMKLVRSQPNTISKLHVSEFPSNQGLDLVEMRAVWACLPAEFSADGDGKKAQWRANFRQKLEEVINKENRGALMRNEERHPAYRCLSDFMQTGPFPQENTAGLEHVDIVPSQEFKTVDEAPAPAPAALRPTLHPPRHPNPPPPRTSTAAPPPFNPMLIQGALEKLKKAPKKEDGVMG